MHQTLSVVEDMIFVNRMEFLVILYSNIKFTTVHYVENQITVNLSKSIENINKVYSKR